MLRVSPNVVIGESVPGQLSLSPPTAFQLTAPGSDHFQQIVDGPVACVVGNPQNAGRFSLGKINTGTVIEILKQVVPLAFRQAPYGEYAALKEGLLSAHFVCFGHGISPRVSVTSRPLQHR
jgi:hypothetical protein